MKYRKGKAHREGNSSQTQSSINDERKQKDRVKCAPVSLRQVHAVFITSLTIFTVRKIVRRGYASCERGQSGGNERRLRAKEKKNQLIRNKIVT